MKKCTEDLWLITILFGINREKEYTGLNPIQLLIQVLINQEMYELNGMLMVRLMHPITVLIDTLLKEEETKLL